MPLNDNDGKNDYSFNPEVVFHASGLCSRADIWHFDDNSKQSATSTGKQTQIMKADVHRVNAVM